MKRLTLILTLALAACSDVPNKVHGKLLCLHETGEAYVASKRVGNTVMVRRQEFADQICKGST